MIPARTSVRLLAAGLVALLAGPAHAAPAGGELPSDPVVRLVLLGVAAGLLLAVLGGTGLWLTRTSRTSRPARPARTGRLTRRRR